MRVNLSGIEVKNFEPIPAGKYSAKFTNGEWRETGPQAKNPGAAMYNAEFTIQGGEFEGRKVWTNFVMVDNSLFRLRNFLEATGRFTNDQLEGDLDIEMHELFGADVTLDVRYKPATDQYDASNDIRKFLSADSGVGATSGSSSLLP